MPFYQFKEDGKLGGIVHTKTAPNYTGVQVELSAGAPYNYYANGILYRVTWEDGVMQTDETIQPLEV